MALIDCAKCGKQVSDGSPYCPHCGQAIPRRLAPFEVDPNNLCLRRWRFARNGFVGTFSFTILYGLTGVIFDWHRVSSATPVLLFISLIGVVLTSRQLRKHLSK